MEKYPFKIKLRQLATAGLLLLVILVISQNIGISNKEIEQIKISKDFPKQVKLYKKLIERVGPEQAQEDLFHSGLPFTGQTHFLNHVVGDYLFEKFGVGGFIYCKGYFLSACEHQLILRAVGAFGEEVIPKIADQCRKAGPAVFSQCSHGIGHGLLPLVGYKNLTAALKRCDNLAKSIPDLPLFNCHDGVFMENIWGAHEGGPSLDRWVKKEDSFYPCDDPVFAEREDYQLACWSNQPSLIYQLSKANIPAVAAKCNEIDQEKLKKMCFNGLARQINPVAQGNKEKTFELCHLLPKERVDDCISTNISAYFSVGDRKLPFEICADSRILNKEDCYVSITGMIKTYAKSDKEKTEWCSRIADEHWRRNCLK